MAISGRLTVLALFFFWERRVGMWEGSYCCWLDGWGFSAFYTSFGMFFLLAAGLSPLGDVADLL